MSFPAFIAAATRQESPPATVTRELAGAGVVVVNQPEQMLEREMFPCLSLSRAQQKI